MLCGERTQILMRDLEDCGIQTRKVSMWAYVKDAPTPVPSHAALDAFINGQWIGLDPYFGFTIEGGWENAILNPSLIPMNDKLQGFLDENSISIEQLTGHAVIGYKTFPHNWKGKIEFADGQCFDARRSQYIKQADRDEERGRTPLIKA